MTEASHPKKAGLRLGEMLWLYRMARGLTLKDIAPNIGIGIVTLLHVEQGNSFSSATMLKLLNWMLQEEPHISSLPVQKNLSIAVEKRALKQTGIKHLPPTTRTCSYHGCEKGFRVFGRLRAGSTLSFCSDDHRLAHSRENAFRFPCKVCGKAVFTQPHQMKARNRKSCSRKCSAVIRRADALERRKTYTKHQLDRIARYSPEAKVWREKVFERDDYTCQECKKRGGRLEADHIKPWAYFPDLRFDLTNGRTLCRPCHNKTKVGAKRMREIYEDKAV